MIKHRVTVEAANDLYDDIQHSYDALAWVIVPIMWDWTGGEEFQAIDIQKFAKATGFDEAMLIELVNHPGTGLDCGVSPWHPWFHW